MKKKITRETWGSKIGVILAVAGSAIGLGNFLRFPVQAAENGGGAFLIPYFISLMVLGIPLVLVEWTLGRYGGSHGYGTAPSIFAISSRNHFIKYLGAFGIIGPTAIFIWYTYIESWLLGFAFYALKGDLMLAAADGETMRAFLRGYQGIESNEWFFGIAPAYIFFLITFSLNFIVIFRGIKLGVEKFNKITMPALFIMGVLIVLRVVTLNAPVNPQWTVKEGFGFLWNPDFSSLKDVNVWMAAAGQIFFTLSVGVGTVLAYASYMNKDDDVALSGMTSVSLNEFVEVIIAGSLIIPAAFIFFGPSGTMTVAKGGAFDLGFVTMSQIFAGISGGWFFAAVWFFMLFIAGVTSSISMILPAVAFVDDEFKTGMKKATVYIFLFSFIATQGVIFGISHKVLDELDFLSGTLILVLLGTVEIIIFGWVFGIDRAWAELNHGAEIRLPIIFKYIIKYVTPTILIIILAVWTIKMGIPTIMMKGVGPEDKIWVLCTRIAFVVSSLIVILLIKHAWKGRELPEMNVNPAEEKK